MSNTGLPANKLNVKGNLRYSVIAARLELEDLLGCVEPESFEVKRMAEFDEHYDTPIGRAELSNVRQNRAGLGPTLRAIDTLKKIIDSDRICKT